MNHFVLIIPTHERHSYLNRSMQYYADCNFKVIYCDSSQNSFDGPYPNNIEYIHRPGSNFAEKILFVLNSIDTKFVALSPDDDFTSKQTLNTGLIFLKNNKSYKTVLGKGIGFNQDFKGDFFITTIKPLIDVHDDNPSIRIAMHFNNYHNTLWGLYDVEILKNSFEIIEKSKFSNDNFIELVIGTISAYSGNIKELNEIWTISEITSADHWGKRHKPLNSCYNEPKIKSDLINFYSNIANKANKGMGEIAIKAYLEQSMITNQSFFKIIKKSILKLIPTNFKNQILKLKNKEKIEISENINLEEISKIILSSK